MAEAEDVILDAARHATIFTRTLWKRYRPPHAGPRTIGLVDVSQRIDLLVAAVFEHGFPFRVAQIPAPPTFLSRLFRRHHGPVRRRAVPATDDLNIWLPADLGLTDEALAIERYRAIALQQAMRASRGSAHGSPGRANPLRADLYLVFESYWADEALARLLPGMAAGLTALRRSALASRPQLSAFAPRLRPLETFVRSLLHAECGRPAPGVPTCNGPSDSCSAALELASALNPGGEALRLFGAHPLFIDWWTGELRPPAAARSLLPGVGALDEGDRDDGAPDRTRTRSARLQRRPEVREPGENEDDDSPGIWMIQTAQPHEQAEDPMGMQRPTDRDTETAAEEYADAISELTEARLVSTPGRPKEVLLSDDPPEARAKREVNVRPDAESTFSYPEWDYRIGAYRDPGATVRLLEPALGPQQWVDDTLAEHRSMLNAIRRNFDMLRAQRVRVRKQLDGEEIDLEAWIDSYADFRSGLPLAQALYQSHRRARRDIAIMLLIDVSGSTDGWISRHRRVIDVEREALLLVCIALEGMGQPYSVQAFSGEGPHAVTVRALKRFDERYDNDIAQRIAALEPEQYTRAGAAIRHASTVLMREPAHHRLLLLLSDGKPNDVDDYEGRYGVEDMRQAVTEAKLQGIFPFCLTIDRQAANYLPAVFGASQYALLPRPELLPAVLLDWLKRLVAA